MCDPKITKEFGLIQNLNVGKPNQQLKTRINKIKISDIEVIQDENSSVFQLENSPKSMINPDHPSPIDFSKIDTLLQEKYKDTDDLKAAMGARHVSKYAEKLSQIQDSLNKGSIDFRTLKQEMKRLETQILSDKALQPESCDDDAAKAFLEVISDQLKETKQAFKKAMLLVINDIPELKEESDGPELTNECKKGLFKLFKHGFLQNKVFRGRLKRLITQGNLNIKSESTIKDTKLPFIIANKNIPDIANGDPDSVDMVLKGPQWDDFSLSMKLKLNHTSTDKDKTEIQHRLNISKRELARNLQIKTGFFKKEGVQSDLHDVRFDNQFIRELLKNPKIQYQNIDLMLVDVLILEAKLEGKLESKNNRNEFTEKLKELGFKDSLEGLERHIQQDFKNTRDVKKTARAIQEFSQALGNNKMAMDVFLKAYNETPKVKAQILLDTILRNFTNVVSENIVRFPHIQEIIPVNVLKPIIEGAKNESGIKKLKQNIAKFKQLNGEMFVSRKKLMEYTNEEKQLQKVIDSHKTTLFDVIDINFNRPKGLGTCKKLSALFENFSLVEEKAGQSSIKELKEIAEQLLSFDKFHIEKMHTPKKGKPGEVTQNFRELLGLLAKQNKEFKQKKKALEAPKDYKEKLFGKIGLAMDLLKKNQVKEKADAIIALRGSSGPDLFEEKGLLEGYIRDEKKKIINNEKTLQKTFNKEVMTTVRHTIQSVILNAFVGSGAQTLESFQPDVKAIKNILTGLGIPDFMFEGELNAILGTLQNQNTLDVWIQDNPLKKDIVSQMKKIQKTAPEEHVKVLKQEKWKQSVQGRMDTLSENEAMCLSFGRAITLETKNVPVGGMVDIGISLTMAKENSLTVTKDENDNYFVLLKGGKSVKGGVNLSGFINTVEIDTEVGGSMAKGCQIKFSSKDDCRDFIIALNPGLRSQESNEALNEAWKQATNIMVVTEKTIGGAVSVCAGKQGKLKFSPPKLDQQVTVGIGVKVEAQVEGKVTWTTKGSASCLIKSREVSYALDLTSTMNMSTFEESKSLNTTVTKSTEMVYQYGVLTPDSNITRSVRAGKDALKTMSGLLHKFNIKSPDQKVLNEILELSKKAQPDDRIEILWGLDPEIALQIAELTSQGHEKEARELIHNPESFKPLELRLITKNEIDEESLQSFRNVSVSRHATMSNIKVYSIGLS